jgi:hypothetical protein
VANQLAIMVFRACATVLLALLIVSSLGALAADEKPPPPRCPVCSNVIAAAESVVVTDFRAPKDTTYCGLFCALKEMAEKYPASRAIAHSPISGNEVRIIRTGARWAIVPTTAVFLILDDPQLPPAQRWRVFDRQARYIQFLSLHRELLKYQPRPTRLPELIRLLTPPKVGAHP